MQHIPYRGMRLQCTHSFSKKFWLAASADFITLSVAVLSELGFLEHAGTDVLAAFAGEASAPDSSLVPGCGAESTTSVSMLFSSNH